MIQQITTIEDVETFAQQLIAEGLNFHPDDDFLNYVNYEPKDKINHEFYNHSY